MMTATFKGKLNRAETAIRNAYITSLYDSGKSPVEIMQETGIPKSTVYGCLNAYFDEHPEKMRPKWNKQKSGKKMKITVERETVTVETSEKPKPAKPKRPRALTENDIDRIARRVAEILAAKIAA